MTDQKGGVVGNYVGGEQAKQMNKFKGTLNDSPSERDQSGNEERQNNYDQKFNEEYEYAQRQSRYAQLLSSNQKTLNNKQQRMTPRGGSKQYSGGLINNTPDQHNYSIQKKQTISPKSSKKNSNNVKDQRNADLQTHGIQYKSNYNLRQTQAPPVVNNKHSLYNNSRDAVTYQQRRSDAGSQQAAAVRHQFLEEQIMDLEDKSHSGTLMDHEKSQGKKSRSRNYQLEIRTDPKIEPKSVNIELINNNQGQQPPVAKSSVSQQSFNKPQPTQNNLKHHTNVANNSPYPQSSSALSKPHPQLHVPSVRSLNSPGNLNNTSSRKVIPSTTKHVPSSNIFQLGTQKSSKKFNPKSTVSDVEIQGQLLNSSSGQWQQMLQAQVGGNPKGQTQQDASANNNNHKRPQSNQAHNNYFAKKREIEQSKESASKSNKKATKMGAVNAKAAQKLEPNYMSETPLDENDNRGASSFSGNVFDETRNNGLNRAAIQDSSQHTQYLSTQGNQLHFIGTPASTETPEMKIHNKNIGTRDYQNNPYGTTIAHGLDIFPSTIPMSPMKNFHGLSSVVSSPGPASSRVSATHSSLFNRKLPRGSAIHYLVKQTPPVTCDLCSLQKGLKELDQFIKEREEKIVIIPKLNSRMATQNQRQKLHDLKTKSGGNTTQRKISNTRSNNRKTSGAARHESPEPVKAVRGSMTTEPVRLSASKYMMSELLRNKYFKCDDYFNCKLTSDIMYNETRHIVSVFKDYLIYDDFSEYMKRFYRKDEASDRLPRIFSFYAKYSKVYPNYVALPRESRFMFKNIERKQKLIDQRNRRMQEVNDKKAAEEAEKDSKKSKKEGERFPGDKTAGEGLSNSKSENKNNLFSSEFVNNLTDYEFLKQRMNNNADYNEMMHEDVQDTMGFDGPQGSGHMTVNKFQIFKASIGSKSQVHRSGVGRINYSNRLSLLLNEISLASRSELQNSMTAAMKSQAQRRVTYAKQSYRQNMGPRIDSYLDSSQQQKQNLESAQPFAEVPSITCSFISNSMNQSKAQNQRQRQVDPRLRSTVVQGFDLNITDGDSFKKHFKHDDDNFGEITSILYTDYPQDKKTKPVNGEDDDEEFAVPSEKDDEIVGAMDSDKKKQFVSKQQTSSQQQKSSPMNNNKGRESEKLYNSKISQPHSREQSAKKSGGKMQLSSNKDYRKSNTSQKKQRQASNSNTPGHRSGRSTRDKPKGMVTKTTQNIVGQAFKNQELLWQAQRASMLKHAIVEVEKNAQHKHLLPHLAKLKMPDIDKALFNNENGGGINEEFDKNIGQSEDFQNFINKYMQQKLLQVEKEVQDNFDKIEKGQYGYSGNIPSSPLAMQASGGLKSNRFTGRSAVKSIVSSTRPRSKRSGERSGDTRGSIIKNRSQKKTQVRQTKFTPSGIGAREQAICQVQTPQSLRSSSAASLMKDISTGQLLKKLHSGNAAMNRIYGTGAQTQMNKRSTLSTPQRRSQTKKNVARTGSRSQRTEERLANIFPNYPFTKKLSQKQVKQVEQDGDDDEELPSVDDEYQGLGKNMQERQHQNHQALQRDVSKRKVPSVAESPKNRFDKKYQQLLVPTKQQQKIVNNAHTTKVSPKHHGGGYVAKSLEGLIGQDQMQHPKLPMKTKKLSELQILSQKNLKDPYKSIMSKYDGSQHVPNIASMRLASVNSGSKTSSILQTKPNSSRKGCNTRMESPGSAQMKNHMTSSQLKQHRDKIITVYPTQKTQTMKGASDQQYVKKPHNSINPPSNENQLNTERVQALKYQNQEKQQSTSQQRKRTQRGIQTIPVSSRQVDNVNSQGAFGPRTGRNYHNPTKSVKTDRSASANFKFPGSTNNFKIEGNVQNEYNTTNDGVKMKITETSIDTNLKDNKTSGIQQQNMSKGGGGATGYSPYAASQLQRKRASAGTTLKSYRPNSLSDNSQRASSIGSGPGIYAKMIRGQAQISSYGCLGKVGNQTGLQPTSTKQRQIGSSNSSARPNYTARLGQLSSQQIRYGSNKRPDSVNSQKNNNNQNRTKSGSLLTPSLLQGQQSSQQTMPSQKIVGHRPIDTKNYRTQNRYGGTNFGSSGMGTATGIMPTSSIKKNSLKAIANSGKGQPTFGIPTNTNTNTAKRQSKKQTIFSVNTSDQRLDF